MAQPRPSEQDFAALKAATNGAGPPKAAEPSPSRHVPQPRPSEQDFAALKAATNGAGPPLSGARRDPPSKPPAMVTEDWRRDTLVFTCSGTVEMDAFALKNH